MNKILKKKMNKVMAVLLAFSCVISVAMGFSVKAAGIASIWLPIRQIVEETNTQEEQVFEYSLFSLEAGNPMPEGSEGGVYQLTLIGNEEAEIQIDYSGTGEYKYCFKKMSEDINGYVCEEEEYTIVVVVKYADGGRLISETSVIRKSNGMKAGSLDFVYKYETGVADMQGAENTAIGQAESADIMGQIQGMEQEFTEEELERLEEEGVPRGLRNTDAWAFANLLLAIFALAGAIILWIAYFVKKKKIDNTMELYKGWRVFSSVVAAFSVGFFFLTEDVTLPITMTDQYTWIMVVVFMIQLVDVLYIWSKGKKQKA